MTTVDIEEIAVEVQLALWLSSFIVGKVEIARFRPRTRSDKRKKSRVVKARDKLPR